jgi:hypothetical protein
VGVYPAVHNVRLQQAGLPKSHSLLNNGKHIYEISFEKREAVTEKIVPMLDKDGKWRVSGYYIR